MPKALVLLVFLFFVSAAQAQGWNARRLLVEAHAPTIVARDAGGQEFDRFERAWLERAVRVLDRLAPVFDLRSPALYITSDKSPNAFSSITKSSATLVGINTDMLRLVGDSDDMMAAVLGHELAHIKARHRESREGAQALLGVVGLLLGAAVDISLANRGQNTWGAGTMLGSLGAGLGIARFTRDQEREADTLGIQAMARAGYDPKAAVRVWQLMAARGGGGSGLWMASHPAHSEREQALAALAQTLEPVSTANRSSVPAHAAMADPYPKSSFTSSDPTPGEVAGGDPRALALSGMRHADGGSGEGDLRHARELAERSAQAGDALGQALLGALMRDGLGGPKDAGFGFDLLVRAARTVPWASYQLGLSYERGLGTEVDRDKAIASHREAAKGGVGAAQARLKALGAE